MQGHRIFALVFLCSSVVQATPQRTKRQDCDCTPGEAPKCGCQVMPTPETGGGQMICTCSPPVPPKCVCTEKNTRNVITGPSLPALFKPYNCVSTCETSCLESCTRLNYNSKCAAVCNEACEFTCAKQGAISTAAATTTTQAPVPIIPLPANIQEYRFVIPSGSLQTLPSTTTTTKLPLIASLRNTVITCPSECMPACSFVCTKLRPTLKVITQMFDAKTDEATCKISCSNACYTVCASSGVPDAECQSNCSPACEDTCTIVKPATAQIQQTSSTGGHCVSVCMPACTPQCMFTVQMQYVLSPTAPQTTEKPKQSLLIQIPSASVIGERTTTTSTPSPTVISLGTICRNECLVQCEHQCLPSNPNCMAACQTTCYPVCQSKMRRRMKEMKAEQLSSTDFARRHRQ